MKVKRNIIEINEELCDGCGQCIIDCAEGALELIDGKAKVISENLCDGLGACIGGCPTGALKVIEREAEEFDEEAVEKHLEAQKNENDRLKPQTLPCGCPSAHIQDFRPENPCEAANTPKTVGSTGSSLTHWPVQIRLVPTNAPFLKGADLLVPADCVPLAYPSLHRDFLHGKTVMMGCPKFDDTKLYIEKFTEIFNTAGIKNITCLIMEVPCCSGMPGIIKKALEKAGKDIPFKTVTISAKGKILKEETA